MLVLAKGFPPATGGLETYSEAVAREYARRGMQPVVITQFPGARGWTVRYFPDCQMSVYNTGAGPQMLVALRMLQQARKLIRDGETAVHATSWRVALPVLAFRRQIVLVVTVHGREVLNQHPFMRRARDLVFASANRIVAVSPATAELAASVSRSLLTAARDGKCAVAFNGLTDVGRQGAHSVRRPDDLGPVRLFTVARLVKRKNVHGVLKALAQAEPGHRWEYRVAGTGPEVEPLRRLAESLGIASKVKFLGFVEEAQLVEEYRRADIFVHAQTDEGDDPDFEGFGLVIADAMAYGCAVLVGKAGGPADYVKHGVTGLVVDGRESNELAQALIWLLTDSALRAQLGDSAATFAARSLTWDQHVDGCLGLVPGSAHAVEPSSE